MTNPIYHIEIYADKCRVLGYCNGFPISDFNAEFAGIFSPPLNPYLCKSNKINIIILPLAGSDPLDFNPSLIKFEAKIKKFEDGDIVSPEEGEVIAELGLGDLQMDQSPITGQISLNSDSPDMSESLINLPKISDEDRIMTYAISIRDLFVAKSTDGLIKEFIPKIEAFAKSFYDSSDDYRSQFNNFFQNQFFPSEPFTDFGPQDIILTPFVDGKIWNARLRDSEYFITTKENDEGMSNLLPIYIGEVNGKLKIVR